MRAPLPHSQLRSSHYATLRLVLAWGVPACFLCLSVRSVVIRGYSCTPNPFKVSLRSILFYGVQPPLIVRLACCSRGRRAVIVFACYVTFFCSHPKFIGVAVFARSSLSRSHSHIFSTQRELAVSLSITFRCATFHFIRHFKPSYDPNKKNFTPLQKTPPSLLWLSSHSFRCATFRALCQPPSFNSQRLRLSLRRQGKHSATLRCFPTASVRLKAVFPALFSAVCFFN